MFSDQCFSMNTIGLLFFSMYVRVDSVLEVFLSHNFIFTKDRRDTNYLADLFSFQPQVPYNELPINYKSIFKSFQNPLNFDFLG